MKLKEVFQIAKNELEEIYPLENSDVRLEQAEYIKEKQQWEIVISFLVEAVPAGLSPLFLSPKYDRLYKTFRIKDSGEVAGFYIFNNN